MDALSTGGGGRATGIGSVERRPARRKGGEKLSRGRFTLSRGFAALRFKHGAELLLEGPATFELISPNLVRLHSGNVFAHVPQAASGFTVEGPTGRVVDKGTDFAVHVGAGRMEVHVLKGLVEAGRGSSLQPLHANQALQMSAGTTNAIPAMLDVFLPICHHARPGDRLGSLGIRRKPRRPDRNVRCAARHHHAARAPPFARRRSAGPRWTTGQFGSALSFDGIDDYVQTDFAGIGGSAARTVAFWAKVPRDFEPKNGYAMICWARHKI
jgi:hypothetical protein